MFSTWLYFIFLRLRAILTLQLQLLLKYVYSRGAFDMAEKWGLLIQELQYVQAVENSHPMKQTHVSCNANNNMWSKDYKLQYLILKQTLQGPGNKFFTNIGMWVFVLCRRIK